MADNVKLEDMNEEQLRNAVGSLIQQLQQADATIRDLGVKVANKEIENSNYENSVGYLGMIKMSLFHTTVNCSSSSYAHAQDHTTCCVA